MIHFSISGHLFLYILILTIFFCNKKIEIGKNENDVSRQRRRSYVWSDSRWSLIESALGTTSWLVGETGITQRLKWEEEDKKNRRGEKKLGIWWCPHSPNSYQTFKRKICTTTLPLLRLYIFFLFCFVWLFPAFISVLGFYFFNVFLNKSLVKKNIKREIKSCWELLPSFLL